MLTFKQKINTFNMKISAFLIIALMVSGLTLYSCKKNEKRVVISKYNSTKSSGMSGNCMTCHKDKGSAKESGWFKVGGTVYDASGTNVNPNTTIKLYTAPNGGGTLKHTIEVDGLGNFYSTEAIDFSVGLYPAVTGATSTMHMSSPITTGECASCHGTSAGKIFAF
jgi:cytochrome c553